MACGGVWRSGQVKMMIKKSQKGLKKPENEAESRRKKKATNDREFRTGHRLSFPFRNRFYLRSKFDLEESIRKSIQFMHESFLGFYFYYATRIYVYILCSIF